MERGYWRRHAAQSVELLSSAPAGVCEMGERESIASFASSTPSLPLSRAGRLGQELLSIRGCTRVLPSSMSTGSFAGAPLSKGAPRFN